jgi:UTP--glucose-1-phosphate uridylyltransferase
MQQITKVVIPVAGSGTRFLPATKAMPKEMLPIVDKPIIQYIVEEAVQSGIKDIILVTGWHKRSIEDHFDYPYELEKRLLEAGKEKQAEEVRAIANMANFVYIRQKGPYGNGTPVLNARHVVGDEPFAIMWGDEFIHSDPPRLKQLIDAYEKYGKPCVSAVRIPEKDQGKYGIADVTDVEPGIFKVNRIVEKPKAGEAPSNLAAHGAWIMPPRLFEILDSTRPGQSGEIWLQDAITALAKEQDIYAVEIKNGRYYDTGNKLEYLKTVVEFALRHPEVKEDFKAYLRGVTKDL